MTAVERFLAKVEIRSSEECWPWLAGKTKQGYGGFHPTKTTFVLAHRFAYELWIGPIPEGLFIDHVVARGCTMRPCCNPAHLEAVTNEENLRRGRGYALRNGMRTSCTNGHEYTPENTYTDPTKGTVRCRECSRARDRARSGRRRAA